MKCSSGPIFVQAQLCPPQAIWPMSCVIFIHRVLYYQTSGDLQVGAWRGAVDIRGRVPKSEPPRWVNKYIGIYNPREKLDPREIVHILTSLKFFRNTFLELPELWKWLRRAGLLASDVYIITHQQITAKWSLFSSKILILASLSFVKWMSFDSFFCINFSYLFIIYYVCIQYILIWQLRCWQFHLC